MNTLRRPPLQQDKSPAFTFVLTLIYAFFIFIRPQELIISLYDIPFIAILSVIILLVIALAHRPLKFTPQYALLLLIYPTAVISGLLNGWLGEGVQQANKYMTACLIPLFIFSTVFTSPSRKKGFMWLSLISACIFVHNGHIQQNSFDGFGWSGTEYVEDGRIRYLGIFKDPNDLGVFFMMNIPFALYFLKHSNAFSKIIASLCLTSIFYGIYMTNSRGTMLAVIGITGLYLLLKYGGVKAIIPGLIFTPIIAFVVSTFRAVSSQEASAMGRLWAWWDGLEMLKAKPFFGVGSNNFIEHHGRVAHNTYIQMAAELGLAGYLLWTTILFLTLAMGFAAVMYTKKHLPEDLTEEVKKELALCSTFFYSLCGFAITAFFLTRNFFIVFYMIAGLAISSYYRLIALNKGISLLIIKNTIIKIITLEIILLIFIYIILKLTV